MNSLPSIRRVVFALLIAAAGLAASATADDTPAESAAKMMPAPGFQIEAVAGEPLIRQPVAIDFDERGRLWVMQYLQYPNPAGLKRVKVDRYSRTVYDRVPEPPPHGPRGGDRLTILKLGADGEATFVGDFVDGLNLASGFALGHDGVFVLQAPYLLFYADRDRDDRPDGPPEALLAGFGMEDAHSVANSLTWGPDGWLYGCQGSTVTANIRGIEFQQGVWRYHPPTKRFELFCEGGGNSWGLDFDRNGELLYSTNVGGHTMLHAVQGGYYWKSFGKHGALHNPFAFGYFDHVPHENFRGGHVTVGGILYRANQFPSEFRDKYIAGDLLGHGVYWHEVTPVRSSFRSRHGGELLTATDAWFAPTDVCLGPDGCVYVADWRDARTAHPDPDAEWDKSNGRVYRISYGEAPPLGDFDLGKLTSDQLIDLLGHENHWHARTAQRLLAARRDPAVVEPLRMRLHDETDEVRALEFLWALYVSGGFNDDVVTPLLEFRGNHLRRWAIRLLGDEGKLSEELAVKLAALAKSEPTATVRSQLASTAKRLPLAQATPILRGLVAHEDDSLDPHIPLLLWWAFEKHAMAGQIELTALATSAEARSSSLISDTIAPRLIRRYAAAGDEASSAACLRLLDAWLEAEEGYSVALWADVETGLKMRGGKPPLDESDMLVKRIVTEWREFPTDITLGRLAGSVGQWRAIEQLLAVGADEGEILERRCAALESLGVAMGAFLSVKEAPKNDVAKRLTRLVLSAEAFEIQKAALDAWRVAAASDDAQAMIDAWKQTSPDLRSLLRTALLSRSDWALALAEAVKKMAIDADEFSAAELSVVAEHDDERLKKLVRKTWGTVRGATPEEKLAEVRRLNNDLRAAAGDASRGRELFVKHCGACHRLNDAGGKVGPDLTHANRRDRDFLLVSLVDPSNVVRREFLAYTVVTTGGRIVTGVITRQSASEITLLDAKGQETTLPMADVEEMRESERSLMPDDLYKQFSPAELRDLFSFLQS